MVGWLVVVLGHFEGLTFVNQEFLVLTLRVLSDESLKVKRRLVVTQGLLDPDFCHLLLII